MTNAEAVELFSQMTRLGEALQKFQVPQEVQDEFFKLARMHAEYAFGLTP